MSGTGNRAIGLSLAVISVVVGLSGCVGAPVEMTDPRAADARSSAAPDAVEATDSLAAFIESWKGVRHRDGGMSRDGIDCSAFVLLAFRELYGIPPPRTTVGQAGHGHPVARGDLEHGDLVFFRTGRTRRHVGIYLGDDRFVHVSTRRGVPISSLNGRYWSPRYWKSTRTERPAPPPAPLASR